MKWVLGNWKMNGDLKLIENFNQAFLNVAPQISHGVYFGIAPQAPYYHAFKPILNACPHHFLIGAQDCGSSPQGAFTGQVNVTSLCEFQVQFCLVGHSERRIFQMEQNELLSNKLQQLLNHSTPITPVFCIGESLEAYQNGETFNVLKKQLEPIKAQISHPLWNKIIVAYEPVWAIGTGLSAEPETVEKVHRFIKNEFTTPPPILYGGSVNTSNVDSLAKIPVVDGVLVGGASLKCETFIPLIEAFSRSV